MKKLVFLLLGSCIAVNLSAQKQTYDLVTFTPPKGWKKEVKETLTSYTITNKKDTTWCQIFIVKSTTSKGSIEQDFKSEWQELVVKNYKPTDTPFVSQVEEAEGWKILAGGGSFVFNNKNAIALLTTMSGYDRCMSIVTITNHEKYLKEFETLISSIDLKKPEMNSQPPRLTGNYGSNSGYAFTTSNFDDGWTSTVKDDWVEVTKGNTTVLLHYPNGNIKPANTDVDVTCAAAWNVLVAPRYSDIKNYAIVPGMLDYQRPYLAQANLTDNATGKKVFVVLFKRGGSGWIEIISSDKNTFIQNFNVDISMLDYYSDSEVWNPLLKMPGYNRFAVAASDLQGKWTNNFSGMQQYVNVYTGADAGMSTHSSSEYFEFFDGGKYNWELKVASGFVGNLKFDGAKSSGKLSVPNNWQIHFSEIEKKARTYNAYFSYVKGGRLLWLQDTGYGDYQAYGKSQ